MGNMYRFYRLLILLVFIIISGCATQKEVYNIGNNSYQALCGGSLGGWDVCYAAAYETCPNGINQIGKDQINHPPQWNELCNCNLYPVDRTLTFMCR